MALATQKQTFDALKDAMGYKNVMQMPKVLKVVVSSGVGSYKDKNKFKIVEDRLARITGQKAAPRGAKVSIANFKSRTGDVVGYQVTLRGKRMHDFLIIKIRFNPLPPDLPIYPARPYNAT